jgi:hypothetical protein
LTVVHKIKINKQVGSKVEAKSEEFGNVFVKIMTRFRKWIQEHNRDHSEGGAVSYV